MCPTVAATTDRETPISAIIPTLNEAEAIEPTLAALRDAAVDEIIVVDGGSDDRTVQLAREAGARVITAPRGRGSQLAAGAREATGAVLWFVHADTVVPPDGTDRIRRALARNGTVGGHFEIRFDGDSFAARFLTGLYRYLRLLGLRYGDSAFFARRPAYEESGGFRDLPIFEDLDLLRRLCRRGRFIRVPARVVTSSRRFEGRSFSLVFARWAWMQMLYWLGVPPTALGRAYAPVRRPGHRAKGLRPTGAPSPEPPQARRASDPGEP